MVEKREIADSAYHPELISLYMAGLPAGIIVGGTITPLLFIYALQTYIPMNLLIYFFIYAVFVSIYRVVASKKLQHAEDKEKYIKYVVIGTALSGMIWGIASVLTYIYAPIEYLFFTTTLVVGLIAGSITSLTPVFKAFAAYIFFGMMPLFIVFLLIGGKIYIVFTFLIMFYALFILSGGYRHYKKLRETIILKDQLKFINEDLEGEVTSRTRELETLNNSLEDKIAKEIEKNRKKDQQMLQHSRMAQMGEMISMIAHQWRQPLGAIASTSIDVRMEMMLERYDLDDKKEQKECTTYIDKQLMSIEGYVQTLTQTIDDFRNFYKPNKKQKIESVNEPLKKSLDIIRATVVSSGIEIVESYESEKILTLFDSELMQVFLNILKNAQDNFNEKGTVSAQIIISTHDTDNGVKVQICDNGGGIPQEIITKVFDPYFSTKSEKNGTGLGLYMSRTIIQEHHNGNISVENSKEGACFIIELSDK